MPENDRKLTAAQLSAHLRSKQRAEQERGVRLLGDLSALPSIPGASRSRSARVPATQPMPPLVELQRKNPRVRAAPSAVHATSTQLDKSVAEALAAFPRTKQPETHVPRSFHVYRTALEINAMEANIAEYDFQTPLSAREAITAGHDHALTFKVPTLPSPRMATSGNGNASAGLRSVGGVSLRHEVHYLARVADARGDRSCGDAFALSQSESSVLRSKHSALRTVAPMATLGLKKVEFLLHEAARLCHPLCADLANLLLILEEQLRELPEQLSGALNVFENEWTASQAALKESEESNAALRRQVANIRKQVDTLERLRPSEAEHFATEVQSKGLSPKSQVDVEKRPDATVTAEAANTMPVREVKMYAFSPERVVGGRQFARHPPVTRDAGVECTDLFFDADAPRTVAARPPSQSKVKEPLRFNGSRFIQLVHRSVSLSDAVQRLKKRGLIADPQDAEERPPSLQPLSDGTPQQPGTPHSASGTSSPRRRSSFFRKKAQEAAALGQLTLTVPDASQATTPDKVDPPPSPGGTLGRRGTKRLSLLRVRGETADAEVQTEERRGSMAAAATQDMGVQAVEMDIDRKLRRGRRPNASRSVSPMPGAAIGTSSRARSTPSLRGGTAASTESQNLQVLDGRPCDSATTAGLLVGGLPDDDWPLISVGDTETTRDVRDVDANTDVSLVGPDVKHLSFEDAIKVRFPELFDVDDESAPGVHEGAHADDAHGAQHRDARHSRSPRDHAAGATTSKHKRRGDRANPANKLPSEFAELLGLSDADAARVKPAGWVSSTILEIVKHLEPFKIATGGSSLASLTVGHFRAKYGLGKMALKYALDFVGNLKLRSHSMIRAHLFVHWAGLSSFAGIAPCPDYCTPETFTFYLYATQVLVRGCSHKQINDLDAGTLILTWPLIEHVLEACLRDVALSYEDGMQFDAARSSWFDTILSVARLTDNEKRVLEMCSNEASCSDVSVLPSKADRRRPVVYASLRLNSDTLLFLLVRNYPSLRALLEKRASTLHQAAVSEHTAECGKLVADEDCQFYEAVVPPEDQILSRLAPWPLLRSTGSPEA